MTASAPIPADETTLRMPHPPDTAPMAPSTQGPTPAQAVTGAPTIRSQVAENPLLSFFGLLIVALLAAAIAAPNIRINDTNRRIDRLEDRMEAGFAAVDARFDELEDEIDAKFSEVDARFDAIELKLAVLIAGLGFTDDVNAAIEGLGVRPGLDAEDQDAGS